MEPKDWLTLAISSAAFLLSYINFRNSLRIADRQYAPSFVQDLARWSIEVVELMREAEVILGNSVGQFAWDEHKKTWFLIKTRFGFLIGKGELLLPPIANDPSGVHPILRQISRYVETAEE
ncbi:MAG: hypothetical protein F6K28_04490, partial [Microcoleus sp. SIO2G3]|nr:hypothetical protein [Microcoleus sp. SIO2G3]